MNLREATVMLVDDESDLLEIFAAWLEDAGCKTVLAAKHGKEALSLLETRQVELLISDINMPVMDGITMVRNLAKSGHQMPIILFISAHESYANELRELGVWAFLPKPVRRTEFLQASQDALSALTV